ncbi:WecB/TagA/CpsF family glycosyltransferase [Notoacmeibacter sp. MSK16QG-6]|uniref:WecB/TagA/CpsF family glycosyltransferase n=1 Tax=Notoacmeibacter sp. MSK16QG-6 TaxID=2957982 RepID=UPI00209F7AA9|nr:WecB/TagA/CpsF family glycosyltransferase [Notoacmeibacter sp. MSK16QG-6]MCP1199061.1 WecB/TagA/CpsF family glycosyltransferase [Notoacmeibacter sp. MSK16QG-6]
MTHLDTCQLFGLDIVSCGQSEIIDAMLDDETPDKTAVFVNAHCINVSARSADYRWALNKARYVLPDGAGMELAARMSGQGFSANLNGTDLFLPLCEEAARRGLSIYFFGSREGVARDAADHAAYLAPGLKIAGTRHGYFEETENDAIIDAINRSGADIVLVALGVPAQELWIARNRHRLDASLVMGVGAQFDFWSGRVRRAPPAFRKARLEWAWRLALEPRRMAKRYLIGNVTFIVRAGVEALRHRAIGRSSALQNRALDLIVAGAGLLLLAPLLAAIAIAIKTSSPGPVLFRQTRIGENGQAFEVLKFRTMYVDAEKRRGDVLGLTDRRGICFKAKNDPRITRIGRLLRRYSLDELPQLFNVLKGQMSAVGPRPALPSEVAAYPPEALERLACKPGLTGVWQVSGRAEIGFEKMVDMDVAYVRSKSVFLDIALLALTVRAVFTGRGAY